MACSAARNTSHCHLSQTQTITTLIPETSYVADSRPPSQHSAPLYRSKNLTAVFTSQPLFPALTHMAKFSSSYPVTFVSISVSFSHQHISAMSHIPFKSPDRKYFRICDLSPLHYAPLHFIIPTISDYTLLRSPLCHFLQLRTISSVLWPNIFLSTLNLNAFLRTLFEEQI
jgi:hypothetical protein